MACQAPTSIDRSGDGAPARLSYAPSGTEILLRNTVNGTTSQLQITAGQPKGVVGTYRAQDGRMGRFVPGCWGCGTSVTIDEDAYAALWPLETGKSVAFLRTDATGNRARVLISVAGIEWVENDAGRFRTYRLDGRVQHLGGPAFSAEVSAWWAPDPGWVIQARGRDSTGNTLSSEVVALRLP